VNDLSSAWRKGKASDCSDVAAVLLMSIETAASKEHLIKTQIMFRFTDSALPRLYCL